MPEDLEAYYGLPSEVVFCKRCVMSNQRPNSYPEFRHKPDRRAPTLRIGEDGLCDACRYAEKKEQTDWDAREQETFETARQTPTERRTVRLHLARQRRQGQRVCRPFVEIQVRHASPHSHVVAAALHRLRTAELPQLDSRRRFRQHSLQAKWEGGPASHKAWNREPAASFPDFYSWPKRTSDRKSR